MSTIERAEVFVASPGRNFVTLRITTSDGVTGLGDATLNGRELAVASYLRDHLVPLLIGKDPARIEDMWQYLYRGAYWRRGPVTMTAISAVDTALWDIKGKVAGLPVYQLLGGAVPGRRAGLLARQRHRRAVAARRRRPLPRAGLPGGPRPGRGAGRSAAPTACARARSTSRPRPRCPTSSRGRTEAYLNFAPDLPARPCARRFGFDFHLLHDVHHRLTPDRGGPVRQAASRTAGCSGWRTRRPAENQEAFRLIRQHTTTPIAVGEVLNSIWDVQHLITEQLIDYVRTTVVHAGGITHLRRIFDLAALYQVRTGSHGATDLSPITLAAAVHLDLTVPNFGIQEYMAARGRDDGGLPQRGALRGRHARHRRGARAWASSTTRRPPSASRTTRATCRSRAASTARSTTGDAAMTIAEPRRPRRARPGPPPARRPARPAAADRALRSRRLPPRAPGGLHRGRRRPLRRAVGHRRRRAPAPRRGRRRCAPRTACTRSPTWPPGAAATRVVGADRRGPAHAARRRPAARAAALVPRSRVVTLTVTEKGYSRRPDTGGWTPRRPASPPTSAATGVGTDAGPGHGRRPAGRLAGRAVPGRRRADRRGVLRQHGRQRRRAGRRRARSSSRRRRGPTGTRCSTGWRRRSAFPATIVDRIVPATTDGGPGRRASAALGVRDEMPVVGEPYRQWVLQDSFARAATAVGTRRRAVRRRRRAVPADEAAPAQRVALGDGVPRGGRGLHDRSPTCWRTEWGERLVRSFGAEVAPTLPGRRARTRPTYIDDLVDRFRNPAMRAPAAPDRLRRIAQDRRALARRAAGRCARPAPATPVLELALAGWVNATRPGDAGGQQFGTTDPAAAALAALLGSGAPTRGAGRGTAARGRRRRPRRRHDLTASVAARLPALRGRTIEI